MKLGMQVGLCPGHIVLDKNPAPLPNFRPMCCGQMAGWIKMPLDMDYLEVSLGPGDLSDVDPAPLLKKGAESPNFRPISIVAMPNGWMDHDGTWHGGGPRSRPYRAKWRPSSPPQRGPSTLPNFWPMSIVAKRLDGSRCHLVRR